jgi:hypothetical protein
MTQVGTGPIGAGLGAPPPAIAMPFYPHGRNYAMQSSIVNGVKRCNAIGGVFAKVPKMSLAQQFGSRVLFICDNNKGGFTNRHNDCIFKITTYRCKKKCSNDNVRRHARETPTHARSRGHSDDTVYRAAAWCDP